MTSIKQLKGSINNFLDFNKSASSYKNVLELIELNFMELDSLKFGVTLTKLAVNPIAEKFQNLKIELSDIGKSFSKRKERDSLASKCKDLEDLLHEIFNTYKLHLEGNSYFQDHTDELNNKYSKYIEEVLNGEANDDLEMSFLYPIYFDNIKMETLTKKIKEYIYKLNSDKVAYEFVKDKTKSLYSKTKQAIRTVQNLKLKTEKHNSKTEYELKKISKTETYTGSEAGVEHNVHEYYSELLIDYKFEFQNINNREEILKKLLTHLNETYPYLSKEETVLLNKITVFGDSNYETVKRLIISLKSFKFISKHRENIDLMEVFMLDNSKVNKPVNLTNGTLNDFAYLMLKLKPFFVDSISVKSEYGFWWSQNFTFNTKEKSKKDVSNMITAIERGERFSEKRETINELVKNLNPIPQ